MIICITAGRAIPDFAFPLTLPDLRERAAADIRGPMPAAHAT